MYCNIFIKKIPVIFVNNFHRDIMVKRLSKRRLLYTFSDSNLTNIKIPNKECLV